MNKVLLDTNVLLDFFEKERPAHNDAVLLVTALVTRSIEICVVATSLKDVYYILTRHANEVTARRCVNVLLQTTSLLSIDEDICKRAMTVAEPDFEDALILVCALRAEVDVIVTRDQQAFMSALVKKAEPVAILALLDCA